MIKTSGVQGRAPTSLSTNGTPNGDVRRKGKASNAKPDDMELLRKLDEANRYVLIMCCFSVDKLQVSGKEECMDYNSHLIISLRCVSDFIL